MRCVRQGCSFFVEFFLMPKSNKKLPLGRRTVELNSKFIFSTGWKIFNVRDGGCKVKELRTVKHLTKKQYCRFRGLEFPCYFFSSYFFSSYFSDLFCMWRHNFSFMTSFLLNYDVITKMRTRVFLVLLTFRVIWCFSTRFFFVLSTLPVIW